MDRRPQAERRTPAWAKAFLVGIVVAIAALIVAALAGVEHGPGRHAGLERQAFLSDASAVVSPAM